MYAAVAPELNGIYASYDDVLRVLTLYPFAKVRKFQTEDECWAFINRYSNKHTLDEVENFGDTFECRVKMSYFIYDTSIYYNFDTSKIGTLHILSDTATVENRVNLIKATIPNMVLNPDKISAHVIAIYRGLRLLGDFVDVEVTVPDHSILYAVRSYSGTNRTIIRLKRLIDQRIGRVSLSLRR